MRLLLTAALLTALTIPMSAQWLNQPTPGIPRDADGKPNLTAPTPRTPDGRPDFTGLWNSPVQIGRPAVDPRDMQPWARDVARRRAEDFFKTRPMFQCLPSGPATFGQTTGCRGDSRLRRLQALAPALTSRSRAPLVSRVAQVTLAGYGVAVEDRTGLISEPSILDGFHGPWRAD
jgi:hypothetical protein